MELGGNSHFIHIRGDFYQCNLADAMVGRLYWVLRFLSMTGSTYDASNSFSAGSENIVRCSSLLIYSLSLALKSIS